MGLSDDAPPTEKRQVQRGRTTAAAGVMFNERPSAPSRRPLAIACGSIHRTIPRAQVQFGPPCVASFIYPLLHFGSCRPCVIIYHAQEEG
jgi:hypothetical protein